MTPASHLGRQMGSKCRTREPKLHSITAGVHCNLVVNPKSVEAQVQGGALMGLSMCLPGAAITLNPDGHPNSPAYGHLKLPHLN